MKGDLEATDFSLTRAAHRLNIEYDVGIDTAYLITRAVSLSYSLISVLAEVDDACGHLVREVSAIAKLHMDINHISKARQETIFDAAGEYVAQEIRRMLEVKLLAERRARR